MPRTFIIAEAGINHNKDIEFAFELCNAAKNAGADAVKFQTWVTDLIYTKDNPRYKMLKELEMPFDFFREIKKYCDDIGIMFLSTPDDIESLNFLIDELKMPIIKVGSANLINKPFLKAVINKNNQVILSTGMGNEQEFLWALWLIHSELKFKNKIAYLHCVSCYPTDYFEVNLNCISTLKKWVNNIPNASIGFSDHTIGIEIPIAAVVMGASVIEKHLTINRNLPGPDHKASLEPKEFKAMVTAIRHVEEAMGDGIKRPCLREIEIRDMVRIKEV